VCDAGSRVTASPVPRVRAFSSANIHSKTLSGLLEAKKAAQCEVASLARLSLRQHWGAFAHSGATPALCAVRNAVHAEGPPRILSVFRSRGANEATAGAQSNCAPGRSLPSISTLCGRSVGPDRDQELSPRVLSPPPAGFVVFRPSQSPAETRPSGRVSYEQPIELPQFRHL